MRHAFALRRRPTQRRDDASRQAAVWLGDRAEHILTRLSELLAEREKVHGQATAAAIERVALTKTWVVYRAAAPTILQLILICGDSRASGRVYEAPRRRDQRTPATDLLRQAPRKLVEFHHRIGKHFLAEERLWPSVRRSTGRRRRQRSSASPSQPNRDASLSRRHRGVFPTRGRPRTTAPVHPRKNLKRVEIFSWQGTLETDKANYRALARWAGDGVWSTKEGCPSVSPIPPLRQSTGWPRSGVWTCRRHAASARRVACAWVIFVQACPDPSKRGRGNADSQITQPCR